MNGIREDTPDPVQRDKRRSGQAGGDFTLSPGRVGRRLPPGFGRVAPIVVLQVILWVTLVGLTGLFREGPNGRGMGTDFAVFLGAANALKQGGNPYDYRVLYPSERSLLHRQHLPVTDNKVNVRAANPPLLYWALEPLTSLPFQRVAFAWIAGMFLASIAGFLLCLRYLGWKSRVAPTIVFLLMPQVVYGCVFGNVHGPVLAVIALCLVLAERHPAASGAIATLGWLKPQLALPMLLLVFLFQARDRLRFAIAFGLVTLAELLLTLVATGPHSLTEWIAGLSSLSGDLRRQPNVASLSSLYVSWTSRPVQLALGVAILLAAAGITAVVWRRDRGGAVTSIRAVGWLWVLWFLATPYTHFPDEVVLVPPLLAVLGRDAAWLRTRSATVALYLALFSFLLYPTPLVPLSVIAFLAISAWRAAHTPDNSPPQSVARGNVTRGSVRALS